MLKNVNLIFLIFILNCNAQNKEKISESLFNYFKLDRENIYLSLNKDTYLNNETIWFKGYILDKRTNKLNPNTTNVYVGLYDEYHKLVKKSLFYSSNGIILGSIKLNKNYKTGKYFLHTYTNYMNNFHEDESSLQEIKIINIDSLDESSLPKKILINTYFEGGKLLYKSINNIIFTAVDNLDRGLKIEKINVYENEKIISTFSTNENGIGKFSIPDTKNDDYELKFIFENNEITHKLKPVSIEGYNLHVNNYSLNGKTILQIKTNTNTINKNLNSKFLVLIQKNDLANYIELILDKENNEFIIENNNFFEGVNTLRLLDENLVEISQRIIYNSPQKPNLEITEFKTIKDSLQIKGNLKDRVANLNISILPRKTISLENNSITDILEFNSLNKTIRNSNYYFEQTDKKKIYELNLLLSTYNSKYSWNSIISSGAPEQKFNFDLGIDIAGKITSPISKNKDFKIKLFSFFNNSAITEINEINEFEFKHLIATDSSTFHFSLLNKDDKLKNFTVNTIIKNNNSQFLKKINFPVDDNYIVLKNNIKAKKENFNFNFPSTERLIKLDTFNITTVGKKKLNRAKYLNNAFAKGLKVTEKDYLMYTFVLDYISMNGFDVTIDGLNVLIKSRVYRNIDGANSPSIFVNDVPIYDNSYLIGMKMMNIDEIYIFRHGVGLDAAAGSIRIYEKKNFIGDLSDIKIKSKLKIIENGFQPIKIYSNPNYLNYFDEGFQNYGTINWINNIFTDENGNFEITTPHYYQKELLLKIEGIDNFGQSFSKIININL